MVISKIEIFDDRKEWHYKDKLHREDGPAVEYASGSKQWWLNGKQVKEENVKKVIAKKLIKHLTLEEKRIRETKESIKDKWDW